MGYTIKVEGTRSFDHALEIFRRETKGILEEYKTRTSYKKPSQKKHEVEMKWRAKQKSRKRNKRRWEEKDDK